MSALVIGQLLESAQSSGVELQINTATIENAMVLDAIERMSLDSVGRTPMKAAGKLVGTLCMMIYLAMMPLYS